MESITISLLDNRVARKKKSHNFGVTPEGLVGMGIEEFLNRPEESFQQAMNYVLHKNKGLYERLAR